MNSHRRQFLRQGATFRPRLERLERRDCPSCTVFQREQTLVILGDESANQIAIADTREGEIAVTCDRAETERFTGVNHIDLRTLGGDDEITATFDNPPEHVFHFRAALGDGNDKLTISGFDPQPDPPLRSVEFDIRAGEGNDTIAATFVCPSDPSFHFRADLGAGNDRLDIDWQNPPDIRPGEINPVEPVRNVDFDIDAGAGDDAIAARFACPSDHFHFRAALGDGNDKLSISGFDPQPDPPLASIELDIRAGAGDDEVLFDLGGAEINGQFVVLVHGGLGNDRLALVTIIPCILPESELRIGLFGGAGDDLIEMSLTGLENEGGRFILEAAGGLGNDHLVLGAIGPCWLPESETRIGLFGNEGDDLLEVSLTDMEIEGQFDLSVLGGEGNDILDSFIVPCILPAGRANFAFEGGAGDDLLDVDLTGLESSGHLALQLVGGIGDDRLLLGGVQPCWLPGSTTAIGLFGNAGDDVIEVSLRGLESAGQFVLEVGGGIGNDHLIVGIEPCWLPGSEARIGLFGNDGDDMIEMSLSGLENEGGRLLLEAAGGLGNDRLSLVALDPCWLPGSDSRIRLFGNDGDDLIEMSLTGLENEGRLVLEAAGGFGNDRLSLVALEPCWLPGSETRLALLGNAGDDLIEVSMTGAVIEGAFDLSILGGVGNDILDSFIQPCILPAGRASFQFDGGEGADRIAARVETDADSRGALDVRILGGLGDDDLTLALLGAHDLALLLALVDGGREFDVARVTRNVRVVNCEEVILLDEPR